jgi:hypothetical protein
MQRHLPDPAITKGEHAQWLALFERRCVDYAARVDAGSIPFVEAIDILYDAAVTSGLADVEGGDDAIQACLARAFMRRRRAAL